MRDKKYRELSEKNTGLITELVRGIKDIKLLNATGAFTSKILDKLKKSNEERYSMMDISRKYDLIGGSTQDLLSLLFIVVGIWLVNINLLTIPNFVILYMYQSKVYNLLNITTQLLEVTKRFNLSAGRVFDIIEGDNYKKEIFGSKSLSKIQGNFEFKNVTFSYDNSNSVIKNLNFKIKANETVAFVGKSGSGKTTIFSLLTKLYNANGGEILIDGININELDCNSIRGNISIITQNPYIFNFSIRENLNIVKEDLTDEEMIEACKLACIHDYIMTLPDKYDSVVSEGGLTLSGGQRQRLAIARALIKKTEIILFDEATSALDNETQQKVQQAINNMKNKYTILIIAHRLSTIINSDRIIVIDNGVAIAEGKHAELLKKNEIYKKLYETELVLNDDTK
jgi:ABC-type multidrug transport system fused ATPase/permease subunit